ncbi:MAG TPA: type II toxin-antitoxin system VapC family toxin [Blastocatellia bacterium]|nr:type II toxin-antitoxin system VapC family toxin [Blastocatellia bacterium]
MSVVADTHAIIWYVDSPTDLTLAATSAMDDSANDPTQRIFLSAISLIEMQYLTEKGKIKPTVLPAVLAEIDNPQPILEVIPIDRRVSDSLGQIPRLTVPDMPDRIIAATALLLNLSLVTADTKISALSNVVTVW